MPTVEERLAYLEGRLADHAGTACTTRYSMRDLRSLEYNLEQEINQLSHSLDSKFSNFDSKLSRHFVWTMGIQVVTIMVILCGLILR